MERRRGPESEIVSPASGSFDTTSIFPDGAAIML